MFAGSSANSSSSGLLLYWPRQQFLKACHRAPFPPVLSPAACGYSAGSQSISVPESCDGRQPLNYDRRPPWLTLLCMQQPGRCQERIEPPTGNL